MTISNVTKNGNPVNVIYAKIFYVKDVKKIFFKKLYISRFGRMYVVYCFNFSRTSPVAMVGCASIVGVRSIKWLASGMLLVTPMWPTGGTTGTTRLLSAEAIELSLLLTWRAMV